MSTRSVSSPASGIQLGRLFTRQGLARFPARAALGLVWGALAGCGTTALPPPAVYEATELAEQIAREDGIDDREPRLTGFVHGRPTRYWIFDVGGERAMPVYRLCRADGSDDCAPIDHPPIVDRLPGDEGYAPYGQVHWVRLPEGWDGQLASFEEVDAEIAALGLSAPRGSSELWHCPIAALDKQIDVGPEQTVTATTPVYVRGMEARCFDFSAANPNRAVFPDGVLFVRNVYVLTRDGEEQPIHEGMRMTDLTGDGDLLDSNNIFGVGIEDGDYTPLWRMVSVTVPATLGSIDTSGDDSMAEYDDSTDMFDVAPDYTITPRQGQVVDFAETDTLINCPLQSADGAL